MKRFFFTFDKIKSTSSCNYTSNLTVNLIKIKVKCKRFFNKSILFNTYLYTIYKNSLIPKICYIL